MKWQVVRASYVAAVLKIIDLIETGIFVLRKKNNQITTLHIYHHVTTVLVAVISSRYISTGMAVFVPILNCSVHVIMYTYYFLSNLDGPIKQMVLPLKRWITIIQMVQFIILAIHVSISLLPSCPVPRLPGCLVLPNIFLNFALFYNFYKKAYLSPRKNEN
ncbi:elongation of very long chain fatty acids protein 4-like [Belonocnema kinseyi]|uniref:elongation of very long chain fatty acids protein 4-like n=1 Tax=Belonocnema kinseyi TaxID=2817044 RepID=UPI00143D0074|nr:elongation of very long chain fatty acids protein 4-like [Belonocnema kinseyi]